MKTITDNELDLLLQQSAQHHKAAEQINRQVMRTVRRDMRLKLVRKWAKLLGLCFGVPLALVVYIFVLNEAISISSMQMQLRIVCIALPLFTIAVLYAINLKKFRLDM
jgi:hypothetical protein